MKKDKALIELDVGHKLTHPRLFHDWVKKLNDVTYVFSDNSTVYIDAFWAIRQFKTWESNWDLVEPPKVEKPKVEIIPDGFKRCSKCKELKQEDNFYPHKNTCKSCFSNYQKRYRNNIKQFDRPRYLKKLADSKQNYKENKERYRAKHKERYFKNHERELQYQKEYRLKNKEILNQKQRGKYHRNKELFSKNKT